MIRLADLLADIEHRRLVPLTFADDDRAVEIELVQRLPHRLDRGGVGGLFVAAADELRRRDRRGFRHPHHLQHEHPVEHMTRSEEHTSELQSLMRISYAVFSLNKKKRTLTE